MENKNIINTNAITTITENTTLGELLSILNLGEKPHETPTPKFLRENAGEPIGASPDPLGFGEGCQVYANGYAVYDNGSGRTVVWLPDCVSFVYYFVKPKDSEIGIAPEKDELPEGLLESVTWPIAVTLIGDHRVENLVHHRKSDRAESKSLIRGDNEEGDAQEDQENREDSLRKQYTWHDGRFGENPEDAYIRKEQQKEALEAMTDKQREVFILYYQLGYTQQEIAEMMGVSQKAIDYRLDGALEKVKKIYRGYF